VIWALYESLLARYSSRCFATSNVLFQLLFEQVPVAKVGGTLLAEKFSAGGQGEGPRITMGGARVSALLLGTVRKVLCRQGRFGSSRISSSFSFSSTINSSWTSMAQDGKKQKTVVVGAGPVGALAAIYAAQRGHDVEIYELRSGTSGLRHVYYIYILTLASRVGRPTIMNVKIYSLGSEVKDPRFAMLKWQGPTGFQVGFDLHGSLSLRYLYISLSGWKVKKSFYSCPCPYYHHIIPVLSLRYSSPSPPPQKARFPLLQCFLTADRSSKPFHNTSQFHQIHQPSALRTWNQCHEEFR